MELVDTHCHLTALTHRPLDQIFADADRNHVTRMICVGAIDGTTSAREAVLLAEQYPQVWATVGIHPHDAESFTSIDELTRHVSHPKVVAVGETGLDFFRDWAPRDKQRILFENSVALAKTCKKPLIIHCRDALEDTIEVLIKLKAEEVGGVFHCYAGDAEFARRLRDLNFLVSFPGTLTFKKASALRETAAAIPLEQIVVETDCPYMAPEPYRGKPSEPMHVYHVAEKLAEVKDLTLEEVAAATTENAVRMFGLN